MRHDQINSFDEAGCGLIGGIAARPPMRLLVRELAAGWMVGGPDRATGPFICRDQAMNLAEGMAYAIRASGMSIDVVVETAAGMEA